MKKILLAGLLILLLGSQVCWAGLSDDNALAAVALHIDTAGRYVPGMELMNKALNEIIRYKVNALFLGSEVQCGNEVLRELNRCSIYNFSDATPDALANFAKVRHVNYVVFLAVNPIDVSLNVKAYSSAANGFLIDKTVARPDGTAYMSTLDVLSDMVGNQVTEIFQLIKG